MTEQRQPDGARREYTVAEYAKKEQVTERTVWLWIAKHAIEIRKTPGGGIRVVERVVLH